MVYRVYVNAQELFQDGVEKVNIQVMCGPRCNGLTCANVAAAPGAAPASPASLYFGTYNATAASGAGRFVVCLLPACTHLVEVGRSKLPCLGCKVNVVGVVHLAQMVEGPALQEVSNSHNEKRSV